MNDFGIFAWLFSYNGMKVVISAIGKLVNKTVLIFTFIGLRITYSVTGMVRCNGAHKKASIIAVFYIVTLFGLFG